MGERGTTTVRPLGQASDARIFGVLTILTLFLGALMLIPARLVVAPMGGVGKPSILVGTFALFVWFLRRLVPGLAPNDRQPIRVALYFYFLVFLLTYLLGHARGLLPIESLATDRAILITLSMMGVALLTCDGLGSRRDLDVLLRRLTFLGAVMALIGILQFRPGIDLVQWMKLPGLELNKEIADLTIRGSPGFTRVKSTALHPIEFGVTMAMLLPIAVHYALHASTRGERTARWLITALIGVAIPFSLSRSGVIGLVAGMAGLFIVWNRRLRVEALAVTAVSAVALKLVVPGLLGTLRSLFLNFNQDPSVQGRTEDYSVVGRFIEQRPVFGRGPRTFLPEQYFALDNQYLNSLITTGWVGVIALVVLFTVPIGVAGALYRRSNDDETRHLAQALSGSVFVALATSFTFDLLSFTTVTGVLFLIIGVIGALRRLDAEASEPSGLPQRTVLARPRRARRADDDEGSTRGRTARAVSS